MHSITTGRIRKGILLPIAMLITVVGLMFASGPALADTYTKHTDTSPSSKDAGGIHAYAWLDKVGVGGHNDYWVHFDPYGERMWVNVSSEMLSAAKVTVVVYDTSGNHRDTDTFTIADGEDARYINLGTPDGSGNIAEGYTVYVRVCVGNSTTCTGYAKGRA